MPVDPAIVASRIQPSRGEDQPSFSIRFHDSMRRMVPDTSARNTMMLSAWADADGMGAAAAANYPVEQYRRATGCEFKEHVARNSDGSESVYSRDELAAMTRNMNRRIADTGNYGTITDGHTPVDPRDPQPPVLGHRGPYYLGQIGQVTPRWAIFSTEHATHANANTLKGRPTRSAEVWRSPRVEDRIIEPLAALGAEAPRLELGTVRYAQLHSGQHVERYMAAAMPGPMSTHISGGRDKYAADEPEPNAMAESRLSPEEIQAISSQCVDAIMSSAQFQFVTSLMQSGDEPDEDPDADPGMDPGMDADASPDDSLDAAQDAAVGGPTQEPSPADSGDAPPFAPESASTPEPPAPEPPAPSPAPAPAPAPPAATDNYAEPDTGGDQIAALQREIATLKQQIDALQKASGPPAEQYRRERFVGLQRDGYQLDVDNEMSMVADFNKPQFERYAASLTSRVRIPMADIVGQIPRGVLPEDPSPQDGTDPQMERYSKAAVNYTVSRQRAGEPITYREALAIAQDPHDQRIIV